MFSGYSWSNASFDKSENVRGNYDYWIVKTDPDGNRNHHATDPEGILLHGRFRVVQIPCKFIINAATGELSFNSVDFEDPQDADQNNTYEVTIRATDSGGLFAEQSISIEVEDVMNHPARTILSISTRVVWK